MNMCFAHLRKPIIGVQNYTVLYYARHRLALGVRKETMVETRNDQNTKINLLQTQTHRYLKLSFQCPTFHTFHTCLELICVTDDSHPFLYTISFKFTLYNLELPCMNTFSVTFNSSSTSWNILHRKTSYWIREHDG